MLRRGLVLAVLLLTVLASPALAQDGPRRITIEVSQHGFNGNPGEYRLAVTEGEEIEIVFVYADTDLPFNNPHRIFISEYNLDSGILDRNNPRVALRLVARGGEVRFGCVLLCAGHNKLQGGLLEIKKAPAVPEGVAQGQPTVLQLAFSRESSLGGQVFISASLKTSQGAPVPGVPVKFLAALDFFMPGLVEIGDAVTDRDGVAVVEYQPTGNGAVMARFGGTGKYIPTEVRAELSPEGDGVFYRPEVGIRLPTLGPGLLGVKTASTAAPFLGFQIPILGAWLIVLLLAGVWSAYLLVVYQVLRISRE